MSRESAAFDAFLDGFFDGFGMAGFFSKLRLPGAPTRVFADSPEKLQVDEAVEPAPVGK